MKSVWTVNTRRNRSWEIGRGLKPHQTASRSCSSRSEHHSVYGASGTGNGRLAIKARPHVAPTPADLSWPSEIHSHRSPKFNVSREFTLKSSCAKMRIEWQICLLEQTVIRSQLCRVPV